MKNVMLLFLLTVAASCATHTWQQQLQNAIFFGDAAAVKSLLTEQPDAAELNEPFSSGNTPLMLAVEREAMHIAKLLLQHNADASRPGRQGVQPLHLATHPSMAALLLENGASPTAVDSMGNTPLHKAQNAAMAKFLLEKDADASVRNQHGFTPIETAVIDGRVDVFDELADNWVRLTAEGLERLRRLGKREKAMAARLAGYQLPKDVVVKSPVVPAVGKATPGGAKKAPPQPRKAAKPNPSVATPPKPQAQVPTTPRKINCTSCNGTGVWETCQVCYGSGREQTTYQNADGSIETVTHQCTNGCINGKIICMRCTGRGFNYY
ncbi:MAG: ankyrin repeat domain-containing protein [Phaeodactylibacter sp.]|nr:ankyrin repeat domain-containing protein [Phaeodactylibacter sp.]